jgi:hypothetical protein
MSYVEDLEKQNEELKEKLAVSEKHSADRDLLWNVMNQIMEKVDQFQYDANGRHINMDIDGTRVYLQNLSDDEYNTFLGFIQDSRKKNMEKRKVNDNILLEYYNYITCKNKIFVDK